METYKNVHFLKFKFIFDIFKHWVWLEKVVELLYTDMRGIFRS